MNTICTPCAVARLAGQYALNWLNLLDHAGNTLRGGDADETISASVARARAAGVLWAYWFCRLLTWGQTVVTFGTVTRDHCDYALDPAFRQNTREIINLDTWPPTINWRPVSEVHITEDADTE